MPCASLRSAFWQKKTTNLKKLAVKTVESGKKTLSPDLRRNPFHGLNSRQTTLALQKLEIKLKGA